MTTALRLGLLLIIVVATCETTRLRSLKMSRRVEIFLLCIGLVFAAAAVVVYWGRPQVEIGEPSFTPIR
jgi:hypothetical protein